MALTAQQQTAKNLTQSLQTAPRELQVKIMGPNWTPSSKELVTLEKVGAKVGNLTLPDLVNIVSPILIDKVFKTELSSFLANNPWSRFYNSTDEYGKVKEHIITLAGTIVNLVGDTAGDFGSYEMKANFKEEDKNPSTLDYFKSKDIVYYTKHIRAFVQTASFNFTELKGAFQSQGAWDSFTTVKTQMLMEQATEEESAVISNMVAGMLIPKNIGMLTDSDDPDFTAVTQPKVTLLGDDYSQADFVQTLQKYTNNVKFPKTAKLENPLGLPLITKKENLVAYVTPDILASQNFLEAYAFTANKVTLPETTEMFAPLPPVAVSALKVDVLGTVSDVAPDGTYTGTVLPIAFIGDVQAIDVVHSELYTTSVVNDLREFMSAQVHDHMHVHISHEKNIRFFAVPIDTKGTLVAPTSITTTQATDATTADGSATLPTTLKDSKGADVTVTSVVTDSTGTTQSDLTKLKAGDYNVIFSASGYNDLNATFTITHK